MVWWLVKLVLTLMMNTSQGQHNTNHHQPASCTTVTLKRKEKLLKVTTSSQPTLTVEIINEDPTCHPVDNWQLQCRH